MRLPSYHDRQQRDLEIKMTPMIDVVFLLLVFFVWTASFRMVELMLPSEVSVSTGSEQSEIIEPPPEKFDFENVVVRITGDDKAVAWSINETPVADLQELGNRLQRIGKIKADAPVILHPDASVPLGDVIDVYDLSRIAGFASVQFAATGKL